MEEKTGKKPLAHMLDPTAESAAAFEPSLEQVRVLAAGLREESVYPLVQYFDGQVLLFAKAMELALRRGDELEARLADLHTATPCSVELPLSAFQEAVRG